MTRIVTGFLILLLAGPPLQAEDKPKEKPSTPAEQYKALEAEYQAARKDFQDAMRKAKTQEERQKVFQEKYPKPDKLAPRFLELAEKNPKEPAALDALLWIVSHTSPSDPANTKPRERALEIVLRNHIDSEKLASICSQMSNRADQTTESFLRAALAKNPHREVQGPACLALAQVLKERSAADKEVEELFDRVAEEYADIKHPLFQRPLGDIAKGELFEFKNLAIGKPVLDIDGEDLDGKKFKLSDYRGKVVMLDFWGHW